jgi:nucleotide-binding universal stress UspA family protein
MKEAAIRRVPLTVITVHQAIVGHYGGIANDPQDPERTEKARASAQAEADKMLAGLDGPHPVSVTVRAVHGFPVQELIRASADADILVIGTRGAGGFTRLLLGSVAAQVSAHAHCPVLIVPPDDQARR